MSLIKKFIPFDCEKNIYTIDYNKLYEEGFKIILFDLDNTIMPYGESIPSKIAKDLINGLKRKGFLVIILSNNHLPRIEKAQEFLEVKSFAFAKKPLKSGYKRLFKYLNRTEKDKNNDILAIGDQVLTDVFGGNRVGIPTILVNAISRKEEKWYTRLNRFTENIVINKMKKKYYNIYRKIKECRGEEVEDKM